MLYVVLYFLLLFLCLLCMYILYKCKSVIPVITMRLFDWLNKAEEEKSVQYDAALMLPGVFYKPKSM